jgi:hypothetical protein
VPAGWLVFAVLLVVLALGSGVRAIGSGAPHVFTGRIQAKLVWPVADPAHHRVYGVEGRNVVVLDELKGTIAPLIRFPRHHFILATALDHATGRLLVEDIYLERGPVHDRWEVVSLAHLVSASNGRIVATRSIEQYSALNGSPLWGGATASDTSLHHGFVIDVNGFGVMLNMVTGAVLSHFRMYPPVSVNIESNLAAVDARTHRLFVGLFPTDRSHQDAIVSVVNTRTGRVMRQVSDGGGALITGLAVDPRSDRVVAAHSAAHVVVLDGRSGAIVARPRVGVEPYDVVADPGSGNVFVLTSSSGNSDQTVIRALDRFGRPLARPALRVPTSGAEQMLVDPAAHLLVLFDGANGTISVYETSSLRRRQAIDVGGNDDVYGMALDTRTHRVIIGGHNGTTVLAYDGSA